MWSSACVLVWNGSSSSSNGMEVGSFAHVCVFSSRVVSSWAAAVLSCSMLHLFSLSNPRSLS